MMRGLVPLLLLLEPVNLGGYSLDGVEEEACLLQATVKLVEQHRGVALAVATTSDTDVGGSKRDTDTQRRGERKADASFAIFACCLIAYAALALAHDQYNGPREGEGGKQRALEWDSVKLFVQITIVAMHINLYVGVTQDDFNPFAANSTAMASLHPQQADLSISHLSFGEWLVFHYDGAFRMPAFAFISGVFGQKVDKSTLLRVVCYTYGTVFMSYFLSEFYHMITFGQLKRGSGVGVLWYLVCLFWWRVTLSPVFDKLKDTSLVLRLSVYVLIATSCCVCYDLLGKSMENVNQTFSLIPYHASGLLPDPSYFSMAPFFACGLILPSRQWTELLRNRTLQIAACFTVMLLCVAVTNTAYKAWLVEHMNGITSHWPLNPDASHALDASRISWHFAWLVYKGTATWAALWSVAALTEMMQALAPHLTQRVLSAGERTMYSYVLHMHLINTATDLCQARSMLNKLTSLQFCLAAYAGASFLVLILTSRLTEKLLHPVVMPFWLLDVFAFFGFRDRRAAEQLIQQHATLTSMKK